MPDAVTLEKQIFPRLEAVAENGWTKERDFDEFLERVKAYEPVLEGAGTAYTPWQEADIRGQAGIQQLFAEMQKMMNAGGMSEAAANLPDDVKAEIMESGVKFISGFFRYTFTPEEQAFIGEMMKNAMGHLS